jgi:hypothetical protein
MMMHGLAKVKYGIMMEILEENFRKVAIRKTKAERR